MSNIFSQENQNLQQNHAIVVKSEFYAASLKQHSRKDSEIVV